MHDRERTGRPPVRILLVVLVLCAGSAGAVSADSEDARPGLIGVGGFILYYDSSGPLAIVSPTRHELPPGAVVLGDVTGRACQYGVSLPITLSLRGPSIAGAAGRGGFAQAMDAIREEHPDLAGVFDVRVDLHTTSFAGFFRRLCTEVVARGFH